MIITCPNCTTQYNVQPALIGNGRSTRCYNCGHTWHQAPVVSPPPPPMRPPRPQPQPMMAQQPAMAAYPQQQMPGMMPGQAAAYAQPMPQPMAQPMAQPAAQPMAQPAMADAVPQAPVAEAPPPTQPAPAPVSEPEPEPETEPEPDPEPEPEASDPLDDFDLDGAFDEVAEDVASDAEGDAGVDTSDADTGPISAADLDEMFGDDDDPEPMTSIMDGEEEDDEPVAADIDPEDLPDPEPVPQMFSPDESDDVAPAQRSIGKIIGIVAAVLVIAILLGGFFARGMIMDMLPFTKGLYEMIGLGEKVGAGLNLSKPTIDYGTDKGKPTLILQGVITNIEDKPRPVPMLKVILRDAENRDIQTQLAPPLRNELPGGERMRYKVTVADPSPLARGIAVIFVPPEEAMAKEEKN